MSKPENPFAFPSPEDDRASDGSGMTLRDWFAGQALTGLLAGVIEHYPAQASAAAYEIADAMLAERNRTQGDAA